MRKNNNSARLIRGPVGAILFKMTGPMVFGMVGMVAFNLVDTFFVGRLGTTALAALTFTFPVVLFVNSISLGLGIGVSVMVSRAIGQGDTARAQEIATASLFLALLAAIFFSLIGQLTINPVFSLLGANSEMLNLIRQYMVVWYWGAIFVVIPMVGNNAIRATGDTKTPSLIMLTAVAINSILDPLLIFGLGGFPRLGLSGAALATVISRMVIMILASWILYYREKLIVFSYLVRRTVWSAWRSVLHIGLPAAASRLIMPVGIGIITNLIASYGQAAVAAYGIGSRIDFFALAVVISLASVIGPFVGQNWTAGKRERVITGLSYSNRFSLIYGTGMFLLLVFSGSAIAQLFSKNAEVISLVKLYLIIMPLSYGLRGVLAITTSALNALKKPLISSGLSIGAMFLVYLPLMFLGSHLWGLAGIFAAAIPAYALVALAGYIFVKSYLFKKTNKI